jgi:D-arabinitol dehydrogenase (NADP+)
MLAQLLLRNGCTSLTLAAPAGPKLDLARELLSSQPPLTTTFVELPRDADAQASALQQLQQANPRGYDIVVEATGNAKLLESGIEFVARGGTLVVYG